jgi:hypothetical protein
MFTLTMPPATAPAVSTKLYISHVTFCVGLVEGSNGTKFWGLGGKQGPKHMGSVKYSMYNVGKIKSVMYPKGYYPNYLLPVFK